MERFENVSLVVKANVYFDGRITSRTFYTPDGSRKTLGIILPGEYDVDTGDEERVEVTSGELEASLPQDKGAWRRVAKGETFTIPAKSKFKMRTYVVTDYICSYIRE
jgi:uncharacterized protein YaiE (UPF0345 family)